MVDRLTVKINLNDVEDSAADYGVGDNCEARFVRTDLGSQALGMAAYRMKPGRRFGFGHQHAESEEIYVVTAGSGRFKIEDEIMEVGKDDVVYCGLDTMREWEAGPDGMDLLAFGHHVEGDAKGGAGSVDRSAAFERADAERAILALLAQRDAGRTICPSEAARALGGDDGFRPLMGIVRDAARALVADGVIEVTQGGRPADLDAARGPIRLRSVQPD